MADMFEFFAIQVLLLAVVLVLHTYIGLHIIRRSIIFCDLVLDQLAAFGALVGIALGIQYGTGGSYLVSLGAVLFGSLLLALIKPKNRLISREAVIGIMYALALAASLLLGDKLSGGSTNVAKTLTGCMLWVTWPLVIVTVLVYVSLALFHYKYRRTFIGMTEKTRAVARDRLWDFLLFTTQGIITVLIVPIAGVLLAYAFLMIPAAIATMFVKGWSRAVAVGWGVGFVSCLAGLFASYFFDLPYGPALVLALGFVFICAVFLRAILPQNAR